MYELDRVVVLAGGLSAEREVSLHSGYRVRDALAEAGIDAVLADADAELLTQLRTHPPSAVFPVIHGASGEDGAIREVLGLQSRQCQLSRFPLSMSPRTGRDLSLIP